MPIFMDRHDMQGLTAADIAEVHRLDLEIQDRYGVKFLTYWFDEARQSAFCLIDAPDAETAMRVHGEAHGGVAEEVIPVDLSAVEAFLGRIADPVPASATPEPVTDAAFRAIMFTDIVESTAMTARLGDARALEMVWAHDAVVRRALKECDGREVKHTGDGIMASFDTAPGAVGAARIIQGGLEFFNLGSEEKLRVRIGIDAGEPVEDNNDLFGTTVQTAARLCADADEASILVSGAVRDLVPDDRELRDLGIRNLKGLPAPVPVYEVGWR
jgi:class 3 adenylate cyclase